MLHINKKAYEKFENENQTIKSIKVLLYNRKLDLLEGKRNQCSKEEDILRAEIIGLTAKVD